MKSARNMEDTGMSTLFEGVPPIDHVCGAYGGPGTGVLTVTWGILVGADGSGSPACSMLAMIQFPEIIKS
jgi:hypothetical protein